VCIRLFCVYVVLCFGSVLATGWSLAQGVLPSVKNYFGIRGLSPEWAGRAIEKNLSICLSIYLWLYGPFVGPWPLFSFLILYTVCRTTWTEDQPVTRHLHTHRIKQTENKRTQRAMPWIGFEPTIPAFERAERVHTLDRAPTVIGIHNSYPSLNAINWLKKWSKLFLISYVLPSLSRNFQLFMESSLSCSRESATKSLSWVRWT
jgi:hypothetical protein